MVFVFDEGSETGQRLERVTLADIASGSPEAWLQARLYRNPEMLLGGEVDPLFQDLQPVAMEFLLDGADRQFAVDILAVSPLGGVAIVEVKLGRNAEARRQIVAQALEYAGALRRLGLAGMEQRLKLQPGGLHERVAASEGVDPIAFSAAVQRNIATGRVLLLLVLDRAGPDLIGLVEDLRNQPGLPFEIAIIEARCYRWLDHPWRIVVVPRLIQRLRAVERAVVRLEGPGHAVVIATGKPQGAITLTEEEFFEHLRALDADLPNRLRNCLAKLEAIPGVVVRFAATLQIRGAIDDNDEVTLGFVDRTGLLYVYPATKRLVASGYGARLRQYVDDVAGVVSGEPLTAGEPNTWCVKKSSRLPRVTDVLSRCEGWVEAVRRLLGPRPQGRG